MGAAALPWIAGASFVKGVVDQEKARKEMRSAEAAGQTLTDRQKQLFDKMMAEADRGLGMLDYEKQLGERRNIVQRQASQGLENLGVALRRQGYRPDDTPANLAYQAATREYLQTLADQEQQLKAQNVQQRMGVLGMVNPGILGPSIAQAANAENIARQNYNAINPFAGVLNLVPYFPGMGDDAGATGGTAGGGGGTGGQSSGKGSRVMGPF
jgi:hypothetical protein